MRGLREWIKGKTQMQCPKCGDENPPNVWICGSCRHVLRENVLVNSKTSKLATISLVLGILSLFLFVLAGIPGIVVGIIGIVRIGRSGGMLRGKRIAAAGVATSVVLMGAFFLLWSLDAPPIPNDYTIMRMSNLLELARFYKVYAYLKIEQRDVEESLVVGPYDPFVGRNRLFEFPEQAGDFPFVEFLGCDSQAELLYAACVDYLLVLTFASPRTSHRGPHRAVSALLDVTGCCVRIPPPQQRRLFWPFSCRRRGGGRSRKCRL